MDEVVSRILVVDDNPDNLDLLSRRLQKKNYKTICVSSGKEALALLDQETIDLVLLDIMMPEISGLDVLRSIRANTSLARLPIIMVTAKDSSEDVVHALRLGANDYITKPIDFPVLFARVSTQLDLKLANDRNRELVDLLEERNEFIRSVFGRYVSDNIVEQLLSKPGALRLGGETRYLTIMFADIRGFTPIAESLPPSSVVELLNNFFGVMTDNIERYRGTINEFYGDGILAFFGAPLQSENHSRDALCCACKMQQSMAQVNQINRDAGLPGLELGVGINTGNVVIGNIGAYTRRKYGIVGASVNLAAHIQTHARAGEILAAKTTVIEAGESIEHGEKRMIDAKGIDQPVEVFLITGSRDEPSSVAGKTA